MRWKIEIRKAFFTKQKQKIDKLDLPQLNQNAVVVAVVVFGNVVIELFFIFLKTGTEKNLHQYLIYMLIAGDIRLQTQHPKSVLCCSSKYY